jgi:hypothetical protein
MMKKMIALRVISIMAFAFSGCGGNKYDAVLFDNASEWMHGEFLANNMTQGAEPYHEESPIDSEALPEYRTHLVTDCAGFDGIFSEFPPTVDFQSEILVIYITTNFY